jgi:hypothetical protein
MGRRDRVGIARLFQSAMHPRIHAAFADRILSIWEIRVNLWILFTLEQRLRFSTRLILVPIRLK